MAYWLR